MIVLVYAVLAAPLMAAATLVSPPVGVLAALLGVKPQGSPGPQARQVIVLPEQCQSTCNPIIRTIDACITAFCACTSSNMNAVFICVECVVNVSPAEASVQGGQTTLDRFANECALAGFPLEVPIVTLGPGPGVGQTVSTSGGVAPPPTGIPFSIGAPTGSTSGAGGGVIPTSPPTVTGTLPTGTTTPTGASGGGGFPGVTSSATAMVLTTTMTMISVAFWLLVIV